MGCLLSPRGRILGGSGILISSSEDFEEGSDLREGDCSEGLEDCLEEDLLLKEVCEDCSVVVRGFELGFDDETDWFFFAELIFSYSVGCLALLEIEADVVFFDSSLGVEAVGKGKEGRKGENRRGGREGKI